MVSLNNNNINRLWSTKTASISHEFFAVSSLNLDEFIAFFSLDVDESEVQGNIWVFHHHTLDLAGVIVLASLNQVLRKRYACVGNFFGLISSVFLFVQNVHVYFVFVFLVEIFVTNLDKS